MAGSKGFEGSHVTGDDSFNLVLKLVCLNA